MSWGKRPATHELRAGASLGPFVLERELGAGGMGVVWKASHRDRGADVALKVLRPELASDEGYRARFLREGRIASAVAHKHLVGVVECGEDRGQPYLATDYVEGETLADRIGRDGALPVTDVARVAGEIAAALDEVHRAGLVHRDLKPANVMMRVDGMVLLTDFGLARGAAYTVLTRPGQVVGTLDYLAPELVRGESSSPSSDIYALGCLVYEALTGAAPFAEVTGFQVGVAHLEQEPPDPALTRPDTPRSFSWAVLQALKKVPAERPRTATAYARALELASRPPGQ